MNTVRTRCAAACLSLLFIGNQALHCRADDAKPQKSGSAATPAKEAKKAAAQKGRVRLPNRYAKIGLSGEQKDQVYAIQAKYSTEIKEIQKKLTALRAQRDKEIESLLTEDQKKRLAELAAEAKEAGTGSAEKAVPAQKPAGEKKSE